MKWPSRKSANGGKCGRCRRMSVLRDELARIHTLNEADTAGDLFGSFDWRGCLQQTLLVSRAVRWLASTMCYRLNRAGMRSQQAHHQSPSSLMWYVCLINTSVELSLHELRCNRCASLTRLSVYGADLL